MSLNYYYYSRFQDIYSNSVDYHGYSCVCVCVCVRVLLGSSQEDHHSLLSDLREASKAKTPLSQVLDDRQLTEQYRWVWQNGRGEQIIVAMDRMWWVEILCELCRFEVNTYN